jgi:hypothetical protein
MCQRRRTRNQTPTNRPRVARCCAQITHSIAVAHVRRKMNPKQPPDSEYRRVMECDAQHRATRWPPAWMSQPAPTAPVEPASTAPAEAVDDEDQVEHTAPRPDPIAHLVGPRRTPWGTWCWSDPTEPPIELFGPPPPLNPPPCDPAPLAEVPAVSTPGPTASTARPPRRTRHYSMLPFGELSG